MVEKTFKHMMMRRLDFLNRAVCICSFFVFLFFFCFFFLFFFSCFHSFSLMSADKEVCCNFPLKCFFTCLLMFLRFLTLVAVSHSSEKNKQIMMEENFKRTMMCRLISEPRCLHMFEGLNPFRFFLNFLSCQSSADDSHEMSRLFSEKNKSKIVFYCSCDWRSKG